MNAPLTQYQRVEPDLVPTRSYTTETMLSFPLQCCKSLHTALSRSRLWQASDKVESCGAYPFACRSARGGPGILHIYLLAGAAAVYDSAS